MRFSKIAFSFVTVLTFVSGAFAAPIPTSEIQARAGKFSIGDVVGVAVKDLSKDPIPNKGNAASKAILHPAIVTDIDKLGNAIVAPVSHTASAISQDVSKLAPSSGLTGFVHVGDEITAAAGAVKKFAGGKLSASATDVAAIKSEIAKNLPRRSFETRAFKIGDVVGVAVKDLSKDPIAGKGSAATKSILHPAIVTDIDKLGNAVVAPVSHTASAISQDVSKLAPSSGLTGFVHVGDEITAAASAVKKFAGGKLSTSASDIAAIKNEIAKNLPRRSLETRAFNFKIGDVVGVAVKDLSKDPIPNKGNAASKAILHPAIVTDIDKLGNAIVAPVSHTASAISQDVSKLAPSSGLTGFVHVGDEITAAAGAVKKFAGGKLSTSASDITAIKDEIAKNLP